MPDFQDNFPLDPPPSVGEDWATPPDRQQHDSIDEVREYLRELTEMMRGLDRVEIQDPSGRVFTVIGAWSGLTTISYGFQVIGDSNSVTVSPSVVSGMGAWATVPVIGGSPLTDSPAPTLGASNAEWIALRMEVEPFGNMYFKDGDTELWSVAEGAGVLIGDIEVVAYNDFSGMELDSTPAQVDQSDGHPTVNGIYVIPLANNDGSGWKQVGYTGPLGVRMCANGAFIALSPARGPAVTIEPA